MKMSKKITIFGIFLLIIAGLVLFGVLSEENRQIKTPSQNTPFSSKFPEFSKTNLPLKIDKNINLQTPEKLPVATIDFKHIDKEESINIASNLEFAENSTEIKNKKNEIKYFWSEIEKYLWIDPERSSIRYGMNQFIENVKNENLSDDDLKNKALDFMINKFNLNKDTIETNSISYYKISPTREGFSRAARDESQLFHIDLTYNNIDYPILTSTPNFQILFVEILPSGEIFKAEAYVLDKISISSENFETKTFNEIKSSLDQAHLIYVENAYIILDNFDVERIEKVDIEKIEIGYYFDDINMDTTLQPIFLLEGEIEVKNSTADWAKLYMPALK